jgi:YebC/PmpR family DNA-binding regulatory protein
VSGHSKWSQIKRQKGAADIRRGQLFTKFGREIAVAVREGGPDPAGNPRLRLAIERARQANMPMENIERAIKRAAGGGDEAAALETVYYEGYGPGGAAILVEALTDNRNRTVADVRNAFTRAGGSLGESGSVAWLFDPRGVILVDREGRDPDEIGLIAVEAGADDARGDGDTVEIYCDPSVLEEVRRALEAQHLRVLSAEAAMVPKTTITLDPREAMATLKLMDRLEELEDVQHVYSNIDISEEMLAEYAR